MSIFSPRRTGTARTVLAGCFVCGGTEPLWTAGNAQGVAARHHDSTGHRTWVEVQLSITYGTPDTDEPAPAKTG